MSDTSAMSSDYLRDFYSPCFAGMRAFYKRFMDEFNSRTAQLNQAFIKENNKEDILCLLIG